MNNTCKYVYIRGKLEGMTCEKPTTSKYCDVCIQKMRPDGTFLTRDEYLGFITSQLGGCEEERSQPQHNRSF